MRRLLLAVAALSLSGCDTYHFLAGTLHEDARRPSRAIGHYEKFLARRPKDPRSCEMRLRAAELYRLTFGRCAEARVHYEAAARDFASIPACAERAKNGLLTCPDYFPLDSGRTWVFVDSASKGKAARLDWEVREASGTSGVIQTSLYAGDRRIRTDRETYVKRDWAVWRVDGKDVEPLLRYPYSLGQSWTAKRGKVKLSYEVVAAGLDVAVAAGAFKDVIKVRETDARFPHTWRYDYYAPGVGRVKTTLGGKSYENPNLELSRYDGGMLK